LYKNKHPEEYTATEMKASKPKKSSNIRNPDQSTIRDSFCVEKICQPVVMSTSSLPGVLRIGWLRMGSQSIRLKNQVKWWGREETRFPLLGKIVKKYLCVCATSVASERVFSTAGYIASKVRNCIN